MDGKLGRGGEDRLLRLLLGTRTPFIAEFVSKDRPIAARTKPGTGSNAFRPIAARTPASGGVNHFVFESGKETGGGENHAVFESGPKTGDGVNHFIFESGKEAS